MALESGNMWELLWWNKGFFDFIRDGRNNLKNFISERFSSIKDTLKNLNILKTDITSNSWGGSSGSSETVTEAHEKNSKNIREKLLEIVARSRKATDVCEDDLWSVSLWMLQWHWDNAVDVLKRLKQHNPSRFTSIMTDPLFNDLDKAWNSVWNTQQSQQYKALVADSWCEQVLKDKALETVDWYLRLVRGWGVTDSRAILAWWRICNAWSWFAQNIKDEMVRSWKNINDYREVISSYRSTDFWKKYDKFGKRYAYFGNKNLEEVIWEYSA